MECASKKSTLTYFHSKKMRQSKGEFKDWNIAQKRTFMSKAATLALKNLEFGFTIAMKDEDYKRVYLADGRPKGVRLDSRYGLCFRHCLSLVTHHAIEAFKKDDLKIYFVAESGHPNFGDAERIFAVAKNSKLPHERRLVRTLATLTSADKKDFPGLQVADVNAYSTFQHYTRSPVQLVGLDPESSMTDAKKIQKVPIFHFPMGDEVIGTYRRFVEDARKQNEERRLAHLARLSGSEDSV